MSKDNNFNKKSNYTNTFILQSLGLPIFYDLISLSNRIGLSKRILYLLSSKTENYYVQFTIPKSNGLNRTIDSPKYSLKLVQRWILKEILEKIPVSDESMAFRPNFGNSIKRNAEIHRFKLYSLGVDVKDFFNSISSKKVYYLFRNLGYNNTISTILTNICTLNGSLPQGGVCSPYLSNLICNRLDKRMKGLCIKREITYSRYADDLTFSCNDKAMLKKIYNIIESIVKDEGFLLNKEKTRFLSPSSHKVITGITINDRKLKASKEIKRKVRTMIHNSIVSCDYSKNDIIRGYVAYINSIESDYREKIIEYINNLTLKDYRHDKQIVEKFNNNKIFKNTKDMKYEHLYESSNKYEEYHSMDNERYEYLLERGFIENNV